MSFDLTKVGVQATTNYLVPSSGDTQCVPLTGQFAGQPVNLDWTQFNTESLAFQPQGAFIDYSAGTPGTDLVIQIFTKAGGALIWTERVKPGDVRHTPFPAPNGQYHVMTGAGTLTIVFVDFPVLPFNYTP